MNTITSTHNERKLAHERTMKDLTFRRMDELFEQVSNLEKTMDSKSQELKSLKSTIKAQEKTVCNFFFIVINWSCCLTILCVSLR